MHGKTQELKFLLKSGRLFENLQRQHCTGHQSNLSPQFSHRSTWQTQRNHLVLTRQTRLHSEHPSLFCMLLYMTIRNFNGKEIRHQISWRGSETMKSSSQKHTTVFQQFLGYWQFNFWYYITFMLKQYNCTF